MVNRLKQYFWIGIAIAAFYFLLSQHIIFCSYKEFSLLKKQTLTLEYTFFSLNNKQVIDILRIDALRVAGIEDVLLDKGMVTEEQLERLIRKVDRAKKE